MLPNLVADLVHHTLQSGLMCLCRIWDKRQDVQSLHSALELMNVDDVARHFSKDLAQRIEVEHLFSNSTYSPFVDVPQSEDRSDIETFEELKRSFQGEAQAIKSSHMLGKMMSYRSKYLAHTTTKDMLMRDKVITERDYGPILERTIALVDKLMWLTEDRNGHLASFFQMVSNDAREDWATLSNAWNVRAA